MSRPVLPSQNSRYWGHDLNNYLLSLASDIDEVNRRLNNELEATNTYSIENVGFITGTYKIRPQDADANNNGTLWSYTTNGFFKSSSNLYAENKGLLLTGTIGFQVAVNNITQLVFKDLKDGYSIFKQYHIYNYDDQGVIRQAVDNNLDNSFYNVYLHYNPTTATVETLLSQQMLVDPTIVLIGTLDAIEEGNFIFIPRCFSASKTLLTSVRDCLEPKISVDGPATNDGNLPLVKVPYYMMINGINPNRPLTGETMVANYESQDCKRITSDDSGWYYCTVEDDILQLSDGLLTKKDSLLRNCQYDLYLSISGKVFALRHTLNNLYTDYNVQSKYDLRFLNELRAGGLVYVGTYYSQCVSGNDVYSVAQTGGIPPLLNATQYSWNKIVLEDKEFHSIDEKSLQPIGIRDFYLINSKAEEGKRYYFSTNINDITSFTISSDSSFNASTLSSPFWACVFTNNECTTGVLNIANSSTVELTNGSTYYLKFTAELQSYLISLSSNEYPMEDYWTLNFIKKLDANKYKFKINPTTNVQDLESHPTEEGYGVINLNLPESNNLMIPVFNSSNASTTNSTFKLHDNNSSVLIGSQTYSHYDGTEKYDHTTNCISVGDNSNHTESLISSDFIEMNCNNDDQIILYTGGTQPQEGYQSSEIRIGRNARSISNSSYNYLSIRNNSIKQLVSGTSTCTLTFQAGSGGAKIYLQPNILVDQDSALYVKSDAVPDGRKLLTFSDNDLVIGDFLRFGGTNSSKSYKAEILSDGSMFCGDITCTSTTYTSDRRYKTNIQPISASSCLQAVRDLNVYSYSYTDINKDSLGMMAQDIEKYLPDYAHLLVHEDSTGKKHVEEHKLLFILWQAVKELLKEKD